MALLNFLATSDSPIARAARSALKTVRDISVPAPRAVVTPVLHGVLATRAVYHFGVRVLVCEPLFKAYCTSYGENFHTGTYLHWVRGRGDLIIGDNVLFDGKISIGFGARHTKRPVLRVGNNTIINHNTVITVAQQVTIGNHCLIASNVMMFDSPGHPNNPESRRAGGPPERESVKPVTIGDNVWIGRKAVICPGVTIGEGSIVAVGAIVMSDVPAYSIVAGNPARKIGTLPRPVVTELPKQAEATP